MVRLQLRSYVNALCTGVFTKRVRGLRELRCSQSGSNPWNKAWLGLERCSQLTFTQCPFQSLQGWFYTLSLLEVVKNVEVFGRETFPREGSDGLKHFAARKYIFPVADAREDLPVHSNSER